MYSETARPVDGLSATIHAIPDGAGGTRATLKIMRDVTREGKKTLRIRTLAGELTRGIPSKDWTGELRALHRYVRDRVRYVKDIRGVETVQTPDATLKIGAGDCDDKSVLLASLLESIGHPTRFVAVGFAPDDFVHVYPETRIGNAWIAAETTEPVEIGWYPAGVVSRMVVYN